MTRRRTIAVGVAVLHLSRLISDGDARYFLLGTQGGFDRGPGGNNNAAVSTIESKCTPVTWSGSTSGATLYDCGDSAAAIAAG